MIVTSDIFAGLLTLWNATPALVAGVPGGLWLNRPDQKAAEPYAVMTVREGKPEITAENSYLVTDTITIAIRSKAGATNNGTLMATLLSTFNRATARTAVVINKAKTVDLLPVPGALEVEKDTKEGQDVTLAEAAWDLTLQGTV